MPSLHLGDAVRAAAPLLVAYGLARLAFDEHYRLDPAGWVVFVLLVAALLVSGARIALLEARPPRDPATVVTRTRELGPVTELVIAGMGGFLLWAGLAATLMALSTEVWAGAPSGVAVSAGELVMAVVMFAVPGFFMIYWRPMFVLDLARRRIRRHRFGRALGGGRDLDAGALRVFAEGYFITNTGVRLGDMIRGEVGGHTFELERIHGNLGKAHVDQRVAWWAGALRAAADPDDVKHPAP
jgi:hypothetical protein